MLAVAAAVVALAAPPFQGTISPIGPELRSTMTGLSWRPGCPVGFKRLRLLTVSHWTFAGGVRTGRVVVHESVAAPVLQALRRLYARRFPIRRLRLVDAYGADDFRSIEADNTSAFNCRRVAGTSRWSLHAYGLAIDVNPIENPYVSSDGSVSHRASRPYVDRSRIRPGMAYAGGALVEAFRSIGWGWGGTWSGVKDYQHFSSTGR
ncbi:MAG: M15 family metallopeptidase [Gaiellaceae bacterium]